MCEWVGEWVNECASVWVSVWVSGWMFEGLCEWSQTIKWDLLWGLSLIYLFISVFEVYSVVFGKEREVSEGVNEWRSPTIKWVIFHE